MLIANLDSNCWVGLSLGLDLREIRGRIEIPSEWTMHRPSQKRLKLQEQLPIQCPRRKTLAIGIGKEPLKTRKLKCKFWARESQEELTTPTRTRKLLVHRMF